MHTVHIRRKRLIRKSYYNLKSELSPLGKYIKKTKKQKKQKKQKKNTKNTKNTKKTKNTQKHPKNHLGWVFFKPGFFPTPCLARRLVQVEDGGYEGAQRTLRYGQRDAEEGVEGVGLAQAGRAGQAGPELGLQTVVKEIVSRD